MNLSSLRIKHLLISLLLLIFFSGCASMFRMPMSPAEARLGEFSPMHDEMIALPRPSEKIVAAVYQFRDQTGQYKPSETGASWSTAVTQGGTTILLKAMEESGWFVPIEREGLSNLLNERRIIRSSREQYEGGGEGAVLPPLLFGGITLEGGIISYETNVVTGGAGLRYFGASASGEYREDKVTVYLRAVSTSTGRILKTVHTSKTILSQKLNAGLFRFVSLKKILEAEAGYTYNEPSHMAVQEAIDKAVYSLIVEGIIDGLWRPQNEDDMNHPAIASYQEEKQTNFKVDYLGFDASEKRREKFSVGLDGLLSMYEGDYAGGEVWPGMEVSFGYLQDSPLSVGWTSGFSRIEAADFFYTNIAYSGLDLKYRILNNYKASPYLQVGAGMLYHTEYNFLKIPDLSRDDFTAFASLTAGYEWLLGKHTGINLSVTNRQLLNDGVDGMEYGRFSDRIWSVNLGVRYYLNLSKPAE